MGKLRDLILGSGKVDAKPIETYGWERIGMVLRQDYLSMIGLNLLYLVCCLPVITIPAATCGLHRVTLNWVRDKYDGMFSAFFREFKVDFLKRTVVGLLLLLVPFSLSFYPFILGYPGGVIALLVIGLVIYFCVSHYFYPLLVLLDVPIGKNLKNACSMALVCWKDTIRMLLSAGIIDAVALIFTNQAAPLYMLFLCSFNCLVCCSFFNQPFENFFGSK